jgi:outer membrane protein TolC
LRAEVAVDEAQRNLFKDRNRLQLAHTALKNILAISDEEPLTIPAGVRFVGVDDSLQHFLNAARSQQPLLQVITQKEIAARQKYVSERANFLPTLAAFGKYELNPDDLSALEPRWVVGVQLNLNLFHGLQDYEQMQSASHLQEEVRQIHTDAGRQVELWVRKAYLNMRNAAERFQRLQSSIDLARENLNANEKRFKSGLGTSLEVIDARLSLQKAQIDRLTALHDYYYAAADLYAASGETRLLQTIWE